MKFQIELSDIKGDKNANSIRIVIETLNDANKKGSGAEISEEIDQALVILNEESHLTPVLNEELEKDNSKPVKNQDRGKVSRGLKSFLQKLMERGVVVSAVELARQFFGGS